MSTRSPSHSVLSDLSPLSFSNGLFGGCFQDRERELVSLPASLACPISPVGAEELEPGSSRGQRRREGGTAAATSIGAKWDRGLSALRRSERHRISRSCQSGTWKLDLNHFKDTLDKVDRDIEYPRMDGHAEEMLLVMERVNSVENYPGEERGGIRLNLGRGGGGRRGISDL